ncbi:hypothetical protein GCM10027445_56730 [Amycolatopsis endophytica]|uniref:GntR family transcriptional regulator n=1 Tax=Amycolatopsis endophytica TaxID=860233 RepID=A0A853BCK5_9PSEU|nr:GntR family transcriptional regulator [Amycolatopsis endophytica]NYI92750.1 GntR family transcriptional regulator [Amycolatopsis endophytica]
MSRQLGSGRTTLPQQLAQVLRQRIREGHWSQTQRLPTEAELCAEFQVSRVTVRQALRTLESQGLITSRQGVGTFISVSDAMVHTGLQELKSITETIREMGLTPSMRFSLKKIRPATPDEAAEFPGNPGGDVLELRRTISADDVVVAYVHDVMPMWVFGDDFDVDDLTGSVFAHLGKHTDVVPRRAVSEIHACRGLPAEWAPFAEEPPAPETLFLLLDQMQFDHRNRPFMHTEAHFIEGRFTFMVVRLAPV